jgi:hypothetical protein
MMTTLLAAGKVSTRHERTRHKDDHYDVFSPWRQQIRAGYMMDPHFAPATEAKHTWMNDFTIKHGLEFVDDYYWKGPLIVVPDVGNLRRQIYDAYHDPVMAGHFGAAKTSETTTRHYWWPKITQEIQSWTSSCQSCQENKAHKTLKSGLLSPLPLPDESWDTITMDWITHLPLTARKNDAILVVTDKLTKMAHFIPTSIHDTASDTALLVFRRIWCVHGMSLGIVSDRDSRFTSSIWKRLCELWPLAQHMSSGFHPQTDGQTERMNRTLQEYLRHYVNDDMDDWDEYLDTAEFAYNNAAQTSTGYSPFYLNYGRHPRTPAAFIRKQQGDRAREEVPSVENFVEHLEKLRERAQSLLQAAQ